MHAMTELTVQTRCAKSQTYATSLLQKLKVELRIYDRSLAKTDHDYEGPSSAAAFSVQLLKVFRLSQPLAESGNTKVAIAAQCLRPTGQVHDLVTQTEKLPWSSC